MNEIKKWLRFYRLPDPKKLFDCYKSDECILRECYTGTYYLRFVSLGKLTNLFGNELAKSGFSFRGFMGHFSLFRKDSLICVIEHNGSYIDSVLRLSFVREPTQEKVSAQTDLSKLFWRDFHSNAKWIQKKRYPPYFIWLKYNDIDFSGVKFRGEIIRLADLTHCKFRNTSWHGCRFNLPIENGYLYCKFHKCDFSGSIFRGVDFSKCFFTYCNFKGCSFYNCRFDETFFKNCNTEENEMVRCRKEKLYIIMSEECESDD